MMTAGSPVALQVVVRREAPETWIAEGVTVDYAVQGTSGQDAMKRFEEGLKAAVRAHVERFGTAKRFLEPRLLTTETTVEDENTKAGGPPPVLRRTVDLGIAAGPETAAALPFGRIRYLIRPEAGSG